LLLLRLVLAVLFEKFVVERNRVHCFVAHNEWFPLFVAISFNL
jgi:hypothetical protein